MKQSSTINAGSLHDGPDENLNKFQVTINLGQKLDDRIHSAARYGQALKTALIMFCENDMGTSDNPECTDIIGLMLEFDLIHSYLLQYKKAL